MNRVRLLVPALALVGLVLSACAGGQATTGPVALPAPANGAAGYDAAKGGVSSTVGTTPAEGIPSLAAPDRDLIVTANVTMKSDDPWKTADSARQIARDLGGSVVSLSQSGSGALRNANLTMRVPSTRFDDAITALKKLDGEVVSSNVDAKDVTDQLVDLDARVTALKTEEGRYLQLFASAKTVDEMLKVQIALSQLRVQIEQLQAQQKSTKDRVAFSNITLAVSPLSTPIPTEPNAKWDPTRTFATAAAALASLFRVFADVAIWVLVFGWLPLVALVFALLATRVRARRVTAA